MSDNNRLPENTDIETDDLGQIILTLEDDSELTCDIIAMFPCSNGHNYIALLPVDEPDADYFLYRYTISGEDDINLEDIEDDDEFEEASDAFDELMDSAEFDEMFDDEDDGQ